DDIVLIEMGEECPADGELIEAVSLEVDESRLTGESVPAGKRARRESTPGEEETTAYPHYRVLRGSMIADGHGVMRVTAVGDRTEIGQTARAAAEESAEPTPLSRQLERLSKLIGVIGFGIAGLLFSALVVRGLVTGELDIAPAQRLFSGLLFASVLVGLSPLWLPIVYDAVDLLGKRARRPSWLEQPTWKSWAWATGVGAAVFAAGTGGSIAMGWLSASPAEWLPRHVAEEFLVYFTVAVTLIVVAVPEGLAMSVTLSLAYSMRKMTATNNLVRRMHACETIGAVTVICSDKTGTLTRNEMRVHAAQFPLLGLDDGEPPDPSRPEAELIRQSIAANSTANLGREAGKPSHPLGNPTEGALLVWLEEHGVDYLTDREGVQVEQQWTFSTERKYMATVGRPSRTGKRLLFVKGAPEIVLGRCSGLLTPQGVRPLESQREAIRGSLHGFQQRGMRTLALAYREVPDAQDTPKLDELAADLVWLGFVAINDPVRPEVPSAIKACREAGIGVKIVTGDNPQTAEEIARQIGLSEDDDGSARHLTGEEFQRSVSLADGTTAKSIQILSRARPLDKMTLVRLLQQEGEIVAVTGDGTNDAPALNYAHVGLSMGRSGTAVAREASDIVLLDDSFPSIVNAVMWGRSLYQNIQRFILFQLTINVAALGIALLGPFAGFKLPLTVIQMLWVNLIMDTLAALALATEPPRWSVMKRPPRDPESFIVTPAMVRGILGVGAAFLVPLLGLLLWFQRVDLAPVLTVNQGASSEQAAVVTPYEITLFFNFFVLLQFWNLFNARCLGGSQSAFHRIWENKAFVAIAIAILFGQILIVQFGGEIFRTQPLSWIEWAVLLAATSLVVWIGEVGRHLAGRRCGS
ncbi:MAG: cation-translocating P-type ATPase, partial [Planctomycetota bacterium]